MSLIINIDTTDGSALVNIARDGIVLHEEVNGNQKDHAAFLHPAIQSLLQKTGITIKHINAFAVSNGPGSYTGIRVGVATAKGLCYATGKPLITLNELEIIATDAIGNYTNAALYCPMIDARRMEVFTAVYDKELNCLLEPVAMILDNASFADLLKHQNIVFCGNGKNKWQQVCTHKNALYSEFFNKGLAMAELSYKKFIFQQFSSVAYSVPLYIKDFHDTNTAR